MRHILIFIALLLPNSLVLAQQPGQPPAPPQDHRQLVSMPELPRALMRADMQDHLVALNEIFGYLAENNLAAAADTAESRIGIQVNRFRPRSGRQTSAPRALTPQSRQANTAPLKC